jgi:hypothetical protein
MKPAWPVLLLACLSPLLGCGEVHSCKETVTPGCLNSAPRPDGSCLYDLVLRGATCVKPGSPEDFCGFCAEGSLCVPEKNQCLNFCEVPAVLPGSLHAPDPIFCQATATGAGDNPMLSFDEVCRRRCRLLCRQLEQFCDGYKCPEGSCDLPEVQAQCLTDCPLTSSGGNDLACLTLRCEDKRYARCESTLTCPNGATPDCANVSCTNDCGMGYTGDGFCDDGDPFSSLKPLCAWGTDCADCGARKGARPDPGYLGTVCKYRQNCAGATGHPADASAWCLEIAGLPGLSRCVPDCSRGQDCPDGFECHEAVFEGDAGAPRAPIVEGELKSQACIPLLCSG